ncbi:sigma-54-dependent transcriptional regulator [Tepidanaerobacter sp. EBM-49]|uniref:sigma 54-interacting transcriptional regulator n=1 Tax=Tepidanaerobacter sp. EBM-49 TaxID=1918504 RepID=UPI000B1C1D3F|nr:sigma-54-dependent transcriptional regulator [Tepidanaerobacter sp. EBM-49]
MGLKEELLEYLRNETEKFNIKRPSIGLTANYIADVFKVKRNTISHYLNQLVKEGKALKINTRPVYFLNRAVFESKFYPLPTNILESFQELEDLKPVKEQETDVFDELIGADGSLKKAITQIKASVLYPGGLPIILCGPTGVGKSFTAELIYKYCLEKNILPKNAPFVSFNCAQYANNPELLSSNLFGYVRGAFTGANTTKDGMLAAADGGILFLDEVHRLNAEGQEKLFTLMDQGVYRRMGESDSCHRVNVRLIFATTEELEKNFLKTFLRRIPIRITIPSLDERGEAEKEQFVYMFLINEAKKVHLPIRITNRAMEALTRHRYTGNMGELKNTIKYIVAASLVKSQNLGEVRITIQDLPANIIEDSLNYSDTKLKNSKEIIIDENSTLEKLYELNTSHLKCIKDTYEKILSLFANSKEKGFSPEYFQENLINEVNALLDNLIFNNTQQEQGTMLKLMIANVQEALEYLKKNYGIKFNGNSIYAIAHFLYYKGNNSIHWSKRQEQLINQLIESIKPLYKFEQTLVKYLETILENKVDVKLDKLDKVFLWIYLRNLKVAETPQKIKAVILAHGYATASSIANVVNRLLGKNIFEPFDMPIDISVEEIAAKVLDYIKDTDVSKGLIILVDMGSLKDIYQEFKDQVKGPIAIINNVSTQMALYLGSMLDKELFLEEIVERLKTENQIEYKIIYPKRKKEDVIITSCQTGIGTALQIQKLLEDSIPQELGIKILAHDYNALRESGMNEAIFKVYNVLAIIGTADPGIKEIPYISLEELIAGDSEEKIRKVLKPAVGEEERLSEINKNIVRNCSLERVIDSLTILDCNKILSEVEEFVNQLEVRLKRRISNERKIGLYVHVSCLVERLIRRQPIETYKNINNFEQCQKEMIKIIKESFSVIEQTYSVKINTAEIGYICDFLTAEV